MGESLTLPVREARARYWRMRIYNGDDQPLQVRLARRYGDAYRTGVIREVGIGGTGTRDCGRIGKDAGVGGMGMVFRARDR